LSVKNRVVIVAPLSPQRGVGHAITTLMPLRAEQYYVLSKVKIFGVHGTPCDCVGIALDKLLKSKPDLIISGIDSRNNRGEVILSSGVVSAAVLGTLHGIPSIALSADIVDRKSEACFLKVARAFESKLPYFVDHIPADTTLNVNYPRKITRNIVCTKLTKNIAESTYRYEVSPFGNSVYWLNNFEQGHDMKVLDQRGDVYWLRENFVTVTPLKYNLTNFDVMSALESSGITL